MVLAGLLGLHHRIDWKECGQSEEEEKADAQALAKLEKDARALANATATANVSPQAPTAPGQPESFVCPVTVSLDETAMKIDNATIPLTPGMTATVEIRTDSRRVIDYLLSPLARIRSRYDM